MLSHRRGLWYRGSRGEIGRVFSERQSSLQSCGFFWAAPGGVEWVALRQAMIGVLTVRGADGAGAAHARHEGRAGGAKLGVSCVRVEL